VIHGAPKPGRRRAILTPMRTLAVIGAGAKGIAIAAKARALADTGFDPPRVVLLERSAPAATWIGRQGYTDGSLPLGTPPEKDVGYPYQPSWGAASGSVTDAMLAYSWPRNLIAGGSYADWVDRGRQRPTHREWGAYLRAVALKCGADTITGEVTALDTEAGRWRLGLADGGTLYADGVVVTGPGPPVTLPGQPREHPLVLDGRSYWQHLRELRHRALNICVIGSGETAAWVVITLARQCHRHSTIDVLTSRGVLYSRGESYDENRFYSDPGDWPRLAESHRREFLERTDRGVFSVQAEATLNQLSGFRTLAGRALAIEAGQRQVVVTVGYGEDRERVAYDLVVVARGFDGHWFERLLSGEARARLKAAHAGDELERRIDVNLAVAGLDPPLHLPVLAGLAQGPGFPNLSCLGLLSDRVLRRYVKLPAAPQLTERSQRV
jgi:mycobactin lysine-N-oxygenase